MKKLLNLLNQNKKIFIISFFVVIFILLLFFIIRFFFLNKKVENWLSINNFSNILEIEKEWKLLSYPEVSVLSESDWEVLVMNMDTWDLVAEWEILMQIWDQNDLEWADIRVLEDDKLKEEMNLKYNDLVDQYKYFDKKYLDIIKNIQNMIESNQNYLNKAIEQNDEISKSKLENEIKNLRENLSDFKLEYEVKKWDFEFKIKNMENEIKLNDIQSEKYFHELEKKTPRSPIKWVVWNIYVQEWDEVKNWDKLFTVINNEFTPEISVNLDFNEYILTKDISDVIIITENENRWNSYYEWKISTRSPILNDEWKYPITIEILEQVSDLILSDDNTKITIIFSIESDHIWLPKNCFTSLWDSSWIIKLRQWEEIKEKEIWIKSKWNEWINIDKIIPYSLEKGMEKDEMNMCVSIWSNRIFSDDNIIDQSVNNLEILCWYVE